MTNTKPFVLNERLTLNSLEELANYLCLYENVFIDAFSDSSFRRWMSELDEQKSQDALVIFTSTTDKQYALFKISHLFNPGLNLIFGGMSFDSLEQLGLEILKSAPYPIDNLMPLLSKGLLLDYMSLKKIDIDRPSLYKKVEDLIQKGRNNIEQAWFDLGFLLSQSSDFYFNGTRYDSFKDFLLKFKDDEKMMMSYDFASMPYIESYASIANLSAELSLVKSIVDDAHQKFVSSKKLSD